MFPYLAPTFLQKAANPFVPVFSDNFNRANTGSGFGPNWVGQSYQTDTYQIVDNRARVKSGQGGRNIMPNIPFTSSDYFVQFTNIQENNEGNMGVGICAVPNIDGVGVRLMGLGRANYAFVRVYGQNSNETAYADFTYPAGLDRLILWKVGTVWKAGWIDANDQVVTAVSGNLFPYLYDKMTATLTSENSSGPASLDNYVYGYVG